MTEEILQERPIIEDKRSFYMGLAVGIATTSFLGFILVTSGVLSGGSSAQREVAEVKNQPVKPVKLGDKIEVKVGNSDHFRGNKNAKVTIVEFSDIQCPFCSRFHNTMRQVMQNYPNDVKWVFKHFPLDTLHPYARKAAEATECAGDQDKFWELMDKFYDNQALLSEGYIKSAAAELGLDMKKYEDCLSSNKYGKKVNEDYEYGKQLGIQGTPGSFVNGLAAPGALPYSDLEGYIADQMK